MDYEEKWEEVAEELKMLGAVNELKLKHLIFDTYHYCRENLNIESGISSEFMHIYKYIAQIAFQSEMDYLPDMPQAVSVSLGDFLEGLCYVIERGFDTGYKKESLPLGLFYNIAPGFANLEADMSTYEAFEKAFDENVEYLRECGNDGDEEE